MRRKTIESGSAETRTATYVKSFGRGSTERLELYHLSSPAHYQSRVWNRRSRELKVSAGTVENVIVSSLLHSLGENAPVTMLFAAMENGGILSMLPMAGSLVGEVDHQKALRKLGYEPIKPG